MSGRLSRLLEWVRGVRRCQCCNAIVPRHPKSWVDEMRVEHCERWRDTVGGSLCDACMQSHCCRIICPGPSRWVHRPLGGMAS